MVATALGPGSGSQIIVNVYNSGSATIPKGSAANLVITAVAAADGFTEDKYLSVELSATDDTDAGAGAIVLGIAKDDIPGFTVGQIVLWGLAQCLMEDTAAVGEVVGLESAAALATTEDAASATHQAPHGIQLETGVAGELKWVFVDFISSRFGGNSTVDGITDTYHGVAY